MEKQGFLIHSEELTDREVDRLLASGVEVLGIHPTGGKTATASLCDLLGRVRDPDFCARLDRLRRAGIRVEYELHALSWLLPREKFAERPEWFRMNEAGERVPDYNLCPSSAEALAFVSDRAAVLARELPSETGNYYFWIDDVRRGACRCPACRGLTPSDQALLIYHAILRGVRRVDPAARQCYLAYCETMTPPVSVRPEEGIFLEYAPIDRDTRRPLASPENAASFAPLPDLLACFGRDHAVALDYWMDNSLFSRWKKPPVRLEVDFGTVRRDIAAYRDLGFWGVTSFACFLGDDYVDLWGEPPLRAYMQCFQ